jgi:hypothetical protein
MWIHSGSIEPSKVILAAGQRIHRRRTQLPGYLIDHINELILNEKYYDALKTSESTRRIEQEVIERVTNAVKSYQSVDRETMSGRDTEARVLTKAALKLLDCQKNWDAPRRNELLGRCPQVQSADLVDIPGGSIQAGESTARCCQKKYSSFESLYRQADFRYNGFSGETEARGHR